MRRKFGLAVGGIALASMALTGCNSSGDSGADSTAPTAESSDFCGQAKAMSDRYLEAIQEQIAAGGTPDEATQKELTDQVVSDLKGLQENFPEDASEEVKTAFSNAIANLESGAAPDEQTQKDDQVVSDYMAKQCPELAPSAPASAPAPDPSSS